MTGDTPRRHSTADGFTQDSEGQRLLNFFFFNSPKKKQEDKILYVTLRSSFLYYYLKENGDMSTSDSN